MRDVHHDAARRSFRLGALVVAGLLASACSPAVRPVFDSLMAAAAPAVTPAPEGSPSEDPPPSLETMAASSWYTQREGFAFDLPPGWAAVRLGSADLPRLLEAMAATTPGVAEAVEGVVAGTGMRVLTVALDTSDGATLAPVVVVISQPTGGARPGQVTARVMSAISGLPGLVDTVERGEDQVSAGESVRFEFRLQHDEVGMIAVRGNLFRFGGHAYLVAVAAPELDFEEAQAAFLTILESLRFGV